MSNCKHKRLQFRQGGLAIKCMDCPRQWYAMDSGYLNYDAMGDGMSELDTRHDPWSTPNLSQPSVDQTKP